MRALYDAQYGQLARMAARLAGDIELGHDFATEAFAAAGAGLRPDRRAPSLAVHRGGEPGPRPLAIRGRESRAYQRVTAGSTLDPRGPPTPPTPRCRDQDHRARGGAGLPDRLRLVVILFYYADLPVAVVATRTGKSVGAVKRDLFDARRLMAAQLEGVR